jgi:hypothetical protein
VAHAHHFLERLDRVTREQTEFALGLYRDPDAVAFVLERVRLPADAERVAIALDDPRVGPFVVVSRKGRFITCLGRGMRHDLPTVPRDQLDALLAKVSEKRELRELAQRELRNDEEEGELFQRIFSRGRRLAREDFRAISAFEAMFGTTPYMLMLEVALDVLQTREAMTYGAHRVTRITGPTAKALERQERLTWGVAHLMMLAGAGERRDRDEILDLSPSRHGSPTLSCAAQGGLTFFLRSAWAAARFGKVTIPPYKHALAESRDWIQSLDSALALGAIGLRHSGSMTEVKRILQAQATRDEPEPNESPAGLRGRIAQEVVKTLEAADERMEIIEKIGRDVCVTYGQGLLEGHPLRFAEPDRVPPELARTAVLSFDADMHNPSVLNLALCALPTAARASAEDFYYPREVVRAWLGDWTPEETLERIKNLAEAAPKKEPVRAEKTPGRNEPCPCGSGKKWKKCHGTSRQP